MHRLWPDPDGSRALTRDDLATIYAYPRTLEAPFVRVNFVASTDGAITSSGRSEGLSSKPDHQVFGLLRELADVILVGAGTARAENYRGARKPGRNTGTPPPIAVVTASARLDPAGPLFTDTRVPPLVISSSAASTADLRRLADAGADVVALDGPRVSPSAALAVLAERGLHRVLCEGGPYLFNDVVGADRVDELCLTVAPLLVGGSAGRATAGASVGAVARAPIGMRLASALTEDDVLLLRYRRDRTR